MATAGFLRAGPATPLPAPAAGGPQWSFSEADERAHEFLVELVGERDLVEFHDDPVEHTRANGLLLLFTPEVQQVFESHLARMPEPRVAAWRDLLAGGASSEAFGPLTLQEQLDERQVDEALQAGRKQRSINLALGALVLLAVVGGGFATWRAFLRDEPRTSGAFRFDALDEDPAQAAVTGGPPVAEAALTEPLSTRVAVEAGEGAAMDRVTDAADEAFPVAPGAVWASVFQYAKQRSAGRDRPRGFVATSCLRASVVTADLRPLDTVTHGPCTAPVGRSAVVGCQGPTAVLLDLRIPEGEVALPEGGTGFAEAIRVQLIGEDPAFELVSLRATIAVGGSDGAVTVPRFGGETGDELTFDLGDGHIGTCTLTGDLPPRR
ncbi:MAG: hypothetical protein R2695_16510 [Acidimicrobiales bacterium]